MLITVLRRLLPVVFLSGFAAHAANFGVSPLSVDLNAQQRSSVITVGNDDTKPVSIRVRLMRWTQAVDGSDQYEPSDELVFFPKRLELKPGEQKIIRAGLAGAPVTGERAYRLLIEELPPVELPASGQTKLSVLLSFALPVFVAPTTGKAALDVNSAELAADGKLTLNLRNAGDARARISRLLDSASAPLADTLSARYVFPGVTRSLTADLGPATCAKRINMVKIDLDNTSVDVPISRNLCKS